MTQADTEDWQLAGKILDGFDRHTGFGRGAWAGGHHDTLRLERFDLGNGELVVAHDLDLGA
ncbi:hypothetical protein D3C73_1610250 [compost metagenome]